MADNDVTHSGKLDWIRLTGKRKFNALVDRVTALEPGGAQKGIIGVAAGYKMARGSSVLGGANPTTIATGLTTVVAFMAILRATAAPGLNTSVLTWNPNATPGSADVYGWKPTDATHPALIASTGVDAFDWIAIGT